METIKAYGLNRDIVRVGLGTWAIGGAMWGGSDERESLDTISKALDTGINLVDTAPVYGFGKAEELVGKALKEYGKREQVVLVTKVGLEWHEDNISRNSTPERIRKEIDDSLKRLDTDYIDVYLVHWPDPLVPFEETAKAMNELKEAGKVRVVGVSNYDPGEMEMFQKEAKIDFCQPPYNMFERGFEENILPFCKKNKITTLTYGVLCRGMLSGKMSKDREFKGDDLRKIDPKFQEPKIDNYLKAVDELDNWVKEKYDRRIINLAVRWALDQGADITLWGARRPDQLDAVEGAFGWKLTKDDLKEIDNIIDKNIPDPVGPEFMAPPSRREEKAAKS